MSPNEFEFFAKFLLPRQFPGDRVRRVVGYAVVKAMIAQLRRLFRIGFEILLDVIGSKRLELIVLRGGLDV